MAGVDWAGLALIVYPLVQIPLMVYLARWFELDDNAPAPVPGRSVWTDQSADPPGRLPVESVPGRCGRCGTDNDPLFTFCHSCLARL